MSQEPQYKKCPYCAELILADAIKCRHCQSRVDEFRILKEWYRSKENAILGGVCAGLAIQFNISVTLIRLAFVIATLLGFWGLPVYITLWIIMPVKKMSNVIATTDSRYSTRKPEDS